ncbi:MAG: chromosomal replication initiator protein DnaA [Actinomycetia bacterium]|nr:chromosomal replication initiator protein DnaA [Actinomycetes bacterium]
MTTPSQVRLDAVWADIAGHLRQSLNEKTFATWFGSGSLSEAPDGALVLTLPNDFAREWVGAHFQSLLESAAADAVAPGTQLRLAVSEPAPPVEGGEPGPAQPPGQVSLPRESVRPRYTFESFVIGSSNRFAHAAALAVAEAPARAYNPLFIYGGTGLGKTHLLQAIAQYVSQQSPELSVRYVTTETFVNDFINSLRDKRIEGFKQRYRHYDVLLVDDVQFLEDKERFQEEFFHTFNSLYEAGRQIILSSDRSPRDIATLENRLRSRFEWGLITDIQPPDLETRIAILRKKVTVDGIHAPEPQVLTLIAGRISSNIRELEGALTRIVAFCSLTGQPMTAEIAHEVMRDIFPDSGPSKITIEHIQEIVSSRFEISVKELISQRRSQAVAYPRQVAMYLSRELTDSSLPAIGRKFGGRDHTTVIYATTKIKDRISNDHDVYNLVQELTARIKRRR